MGPITGNPELDALLARVRTWVAEDPKPSDARTLQLLVYRVEDGEEEAAAELRELFRTALAFGTAGLRGPLGPGPNRMNRAVVRRATAGVAGWVLAGGAGDPRGGVVIGRDARYGSEVFETEAVEVLAGHGLAVHVLPDLVPTPVLAYAVRHLGAAAGIMVTASHNPATDNGYKVYDGEGRQVDVDQASAIVAHMEAAGPLSQVPLSGAANPLIQRVSLDIVDEYLTELLATVLRGRGDQAPVQVAYTPLHGVAGATVRRACRMTGFVTLHEVPEQAEPVPDFPTVPSPNPEEPGVLDKLRGQAAWAGADVALANDPDGDRLAMAVHDPERGAVRDQVAWRVLSGDELGWLLADHLVRRGGLPPEGVFATTIVSSTLLRALAVDAGVPYAETLTGFKWIVRSPGPGRRLAFGYEEALGYCVGDLVQDKDGIGALLLAAEMVSDLASGGVTVLDRLDELARGFGVHATGRWTALLEGAEGAARIAGAMARLRSSPPVALAGRRVAGVADLLDGTPRPTLPPADVVGLALEGARVVVRPSGTEPRLKCYVEVVEPVSDGDLAGARARADEGLATLLAALPPALGLD
ncbi:MAG TPA: phospho-sugar mutase [Acidimicrobiales bacterium]|nr:phospho-sugar mutase [Acidimicrobiales bacterium]